MFRKWLQSQKNLRSLDHEDGFSLVELMIVVVIIGIIAAIAIPVYNNQIREAEIATLKSDVQATMTTFSQWQQNNGMYAVPTPTEFTSEIKVISDPKNTINFSVLSQNDPDNFEICIQGSRTFSASDTVLWNYNSQTKKLSAGACTDAPNVNKEVLN